MKVHNTLSTRILQTVEFAMVAQARARVDGHTRDAIETRVELRVFTRTRMHYQHLDWRVRAEGNRIGGEGER